MKKIWKKNHNKQIQRWNKAPFSLQKKIPRNDSFFWLKCIPNGIFFYKYNKWPYNQMQLKMKCELIYSSECSLSIHTCTIVDRTHLMAWHKFISHAWPFHYPIFDHGALIDCFTKHAMNSGYSAICSFCDWHRFGRTVYFYIDLFIFKNFLFTFK